MIANSWDASSGSKLRTRAHSLGQSLTHQVDRSLRRLAAGADPTTEQGMR